MSLSGKTFRSFGALFGILIAACAAASLINLSTGHLSLSWQDFLSSTENSELASLRINRVLSMFLAGISLPVSGFLLQEYFQNPLAGPSVLGITSVASLSVAFYIFLSGSLILPAMVQNGFIGTAAIAGSFVLMLFLMAVSSRFRDNSYLIIFGFLISALAGAVVNILQFYGDNQSLKNYILWSFGANNLVSGDQLLLLGALSFCGLFLSFKTIKPLIGNSLGASYAMSFGVNLMALKYLVILSSSLLCASVTAFLGPVLFIGIVVPHFCRLIYNPAQLWQQWLLNMAMGVLVMQVFSCLSEASALPLNVITSVFGIPVILLMMMQKKSSAKTV